MSGRPLCTVTSAEPSSAAVLDGKVENIRAYQFLLKLAGEMLHFLVSKDLWIAPNEERTSLHLVCKSLVSNRLIGENNEGKILPLITLTS